MSFDPGQSSPQSPQQSFNQGGPGQQAATPGTFYSTPNSFYPDPATQPASQFGQPAASINPYEYGGVASPPPPPPSPLPRRTSRRRLWIILVIVVLLVAGGVTSAVLVLTAPTRAVDQVVQNYYTAVEQQDYATAFTYVDREYLTNNGLEVSLSRATYVLTSRATDSAEGTLTAYSIVSTSVTGSVALVIVNVTRGGIVRQVQVALQQVDGTWEIDRVG